MNDGYAFAERHVHQVSNGIQEIRRIVNAYTEMALRQDARAYERVKNRIKLEIEVRGDGAYMLIRREARRI